MTYEKTNWQVGDTITAEKLNKIEDQVAANEEAISSAGGATLVVTYSEEGTTGTLDKTWNEIKDAFPNVVIEDSPNRTTSICEQVYYEEGTGYGVRCQFGNMNLTTQSADGYPTVSYD